MRPGTRCPSPAELEQARWTADPRLTAHVEGCPRCRAVWQEIDELADLAASLPAPAEPAPQRLEEQRTALLAGLRSAPPPVPARRWPIAAIAGAALAACAVWWAWPEPVAAPRPGQAQLLAWGDAGYLVSEADGAQLVRLVTGHLTLAARPSAPLRVVVGELEVGSVAGTFDVVAEADRLRSLRVLIGSVELRGPGVPAGGGLRIAAGETWTAPTDDPPAGPVAGSPVVAITPGPPPAPVVQPARPVPRPAAVSLPPAPPAPAAPVDAGVTPPVVRGPAAEAFADGWANLRTGSFAAAAADFARAESLADDARAREDASYWRAVALARASQLGLAVTAFEHFLAGFPASPHHGEASVALGWLLLERGDLAGARARFQAGALDTSPRVRASAAAGLAALP